MSQQLGDEVTSDQLPEDLFIRDPNEAMPTLEERFRRIVKEEISGFRAEQQAPQQHADALRGAVAEWYEEQANGVSEETVVKATQLMRQRVGMERLTPEIVTGLFPDYVDLVQRSELAA